MSSAGGESCQRVRKYEEDVVLLFEAYWKIFSGIFGGFSGLMRWRQRRTIGLDIENNSEDWEEVVCLSQTLCGIIISPREKNEAESSF